MKVFLVPPLFSDEDVDAADLIEVISHGFDGRHDVLQPLPRTVTRSGVGSLNKESRSRLSVGLRLTSAVRRYAAEPFDDPD